MYLRFSLRQIHYTISCILYIQLCRRVFVYRNYFGIIILSGSLKRENNYGTAQLSYDRTEIE